MINREKRIVDPTIPDADLAALVLEVVYGWNHVDAMVTDDSGKTRDQHLLLPSCFKNLPSLYEADLPQPMVETRLDILLPKVEAVFKRGLRWRPDNHLLIGYQEDYDDASFAIDTPTLWRGFCYVLLWNQGWRIYHV